MGKTYVSTVKYAVRIDFEVNGIVDKHDVVGAIFGQSEGLLGEEMDLKELQNSGKIGRIEVINTFENGKTIGELIVPSSMDMVETTMLAAAIETVDKVGPCEASFKVKGIEDTRTEKRKEIVSRAKELLETMIKDKLPETQEIAEKVRANMRTSEVQYFGEEKLACGPGLFEEDEIIIVEGRADVLNLLKNSFKNAVAMDGSKAGKSIVDLTKTKTVTLFVDGDRGGELNIRKLQEMGAQIDFIARAPDGKEVEELTRKEITMALRKKIQITTGKETKPKEITRTIIQKTIPRTSFGKIGERKNFSQRTPMRRTEYQAKKEYPSRTSSFTRNDFQRTSIAPVLTSFPKKITLTEEEKKFQPVLGELKGTLKAKLLNEKFETIQETTVRELLETTEKQEKLFAIVFDGIITQRLMDLAKNKQAKFVIGIKKAKIKEEKEPKAITFE